mmetsp:Transcript_38920/g.70222  ORF Transcript_38920/g.70222 Transcript_38920/m.70222 type:complete len:85 (-) Transcript_38920:511-765(-)
MRQRSSSNQAPAFGARKLAMLFCFITLRGRLGGGVCCEGTAGTDRDGVLSSHGKGLEELLEELELDSTETERLEGLGLGAAAVA